jgi:hypothetical protein
MCSQHDAEHDAELYAGTMPSTMLAPKTGNIGILDTAVKAARLGHGSEDSSLGHGSEGYTPTP